MRKVTKVQEVIEKKLAEALHPALLKVEDFSASHQAHLEEAKQGGTHFRVVLVSESFTGKKPVERHRLVQKILSEELQQGVHALTLTLLTPEEAK